MKQTKISRSFFSFYFIYFSFTSSFIKKSIIFLLDWKVKIITSWERLKKRNEKQIGGGGNTGEGNFLSWLVAKQQFLLYLQKWENISQPYRSHLMAPSNYFIFFYFLFPSVFFLSYPFSFFFCCCFFFN